MSDFSVQPTKSVAAGALVVEGSVAQLKEKLAEVSIKPTFICGYISPFLDIEQVEAIVAARFPDVPKIISSTAGELRAHDNQLYCKAGEYWDHIVIQCFDGAIIEQAEVVSLPLGSEDLRKKKIEINLKERIKRIKKCIQNLTVSMDIDHRDTLAYTVFDGLSGSESFFMEALYDSDCFPCLFVGGSAGGKNSFTDTWIHDGRKTLQNHVSIAFLKTAPGIRFGIMKSQNFTPSEISFNILSASMEFRSVSQVVDQTGQIMSLVDALCDTFQCKPAALDAEMAEFSFAISIDDELYIRSISWIDLEMNIVYFYCDISPGEELILVKKEDLVTCTRSDFAKFMENKPGPPVAGMLADCVLRRVLNESKLDGMGGVFSQNSIAGFSTFGEILGIYLNQTLTGIFFFQVPEGFHFREDYVDSYPLYYSKFKAFFLKRQIAKLNSLSKIMVQQIDAYKNRDYESRLNAIGLDPTMTTVFDGLNDLGLVLGEADARQRLEADQIAKRLLESEERFRLLSESSLTGIYYVEDGGTFKYVNDAFAHMYGFKVSEIVNRLGIEDLALPEDVPRILENVRRRVTGEEMSIRYTFRAIRKNGSVFHVEVHGRRINFRGKVGVIGTLIDITEQKKIEAELKASEERYRTFYNRTPSMFFTVDKAGTIAAVNDFAADQLGYRNNELLGNYFLNLFHKEDRDTVKSGIASCLKTPGKIFSWQLRVVHKDGRIIWIEEFVRSMIGPERKERIFVVCQNITARKELEESLKLTRFIFDKAAIGIFLIDGDNRVADVNEYGCSSLGYTKEELCGLSVLEYEQKFNREQLADYLAKLQETRTAAFESVHKRKNGETFPVQVFVSVLPGGDRNFRVAFVTDITDWKRSKIEQEKLESQLKQVQKLESIGRLAGGVAHDLNNLLTPILGYAELLSFDRNIDEKAKKKLSVVSKAATGAKDLVRQLLAFSRKQILEYQPIDINCVVDDFKKLIRRTVREDIEIDIQKSDEMMLILADRGQVEQVLLNLIVNASDAMPDGGKIYIKTGLAELDPTFTRSHFDVAPGPYVMLEIRDTGCGMDRDTLTHIFEPFFSTKGDRGTGLGLATVYGIVRQHNGTLSVDSCPGQGATFQVYLPVTDQQPGRQEGQPLRQISDQATETILLVEDNEVVRVTVRDILQQKGYRVIMAGDGETALQMVRAGTKMDMLITDVVMPGMNGKELFKKLSKQYLDLRVLYMSGYTDDIINHHGLLDKQTHYIQKPFSTFALLQKVRDVLSS